MVDTYEGMVDTYEGNAVLYIFIALLHKMWNQF